tara:strand:- start:610 stop:1317 length:708 start_codon:yes stop_codon:yes gene_type:complete
MTDVRLTALNPVDSQVYPVACNTSGELIVEQVDPGPDLTVTGDLTVDGTASFNNGDVNIDSSGRLAIGATNPTRKLSINSGAIDTAALFESSDQDCHINFQDGTSSSGGVSIGVRGDAFYVRTGLSTERMRIVSSGNVGINNTNPSAKLDVDGTGNFTGDVQGQSFIGDRSTGGNAVFAGKQNGTLKTRINADGSATFAGNVTAPNITSLNTLVEELQTKMSLILRQIDISAETP